MPHFMGFTRICRCLVLSVNPTPRTKIQRLYSEKLTIFRPLVAKITVAREETHGFDLPML